MAAVVCGMAVALAATSAAAVAPVSVSRNDGSDRYQVARTTAAAAFPGGAKTVLLARGDLYPDALAASYLAGDVGAPIVLTTGGTLHPDAKLALANLNADNVRLVGGTAAISDSVKTELQALGYNVSRIAGVDRYQTAADIASSAGKGTIGQLAGKRTAIVASGVNYPDALAGGPVSYAAQFPILLTAPDALNAVTSSTLNTLGIEHVLLLGGTDAVSVAVANQLATGGRTVQRIADVDRYGTAARIADFARASLGWVIDDVVLATGLDFPDAEVGGPLGGVRKAPILLVAETLPASSEAYCRANRSTIKALVVQGNPFSVSNASVDACKTAAESLP